MKELTCEEVGCNCGDIPLRLAEKEFITQEYYEVARELSDRCATQAKRIRDLEAQLTAPLRCQRHPADCATGGVIRREDPCPVCSSCADNDLRAARDVALEEAARVADWCGVGEIIRFRLRSQPAARLYSMEEVEASFSEVLGGEISENWWKKLRAALEGKKP